MLDKLNRNIDTLSIKNNGNAEIFINQLKYLHSTKPLLCFRMCGVHFYNGMINFFFVNLLNQTF